MAIDLNIPVGSEGIRARDRFETRLIDDVSGRSQHFTILYIIEMLYSIERTGGRRAYDFVVELAIGCRYLASAIFEPSGEEIGARRTAVVASRELRRHDKNLLVQELRGLK